MLGQWRLGSSWELLLFVANSMALVLLGVAGLGYGSIKLMSASLVGAPPLLEPVPTGSEGHQFVGVQQILILG